MIIKPDFNVKSLFDINIEQLKEMGAKAILFDLDSTVMASKTGVYEEKVYSWLCDLNEQFKIAILSNNNNKKYIHNIAQQSCFEVIGSAAKPDTAVALKYLNEWEIAPSETVIVGDRPLTDILLGKRLGAITILVDSITCDTEPKIVRFVRFLDRLVIKK